MGKKRLLIIDSNALLHRAFHALPPLTTKKGEQTGALYGFLSTLFKAIKDLNPDYLMACFDTPAPTFRHQKFEEYKAQRPETPLEMKPQIAKAKEILSELEIPVFSREGFEADDLIATIVRRFSQKLKTGEIYIITGDLDNLQLVNENTKVYTLGRGIKETVIYDTEKVVSRFGILPEQIVDFKALVGDPSDNIPGALGIGKKTAAELLKKFGSIENIYREIESNSNIYSHLSGKGQEKDKTEIQPRIKDILLKNKAQVFLSKELVKMKSDVDIDIAIEKCAFRGFDPEKAAKTLSRFEFYSLINRLSSFAKEAPAGTKKLL